MKLVSRLRIIADEAEEAVALALHDTANFILTLIRSFAPVDTGFLRDSYQKESEALLHILIGSMVAYSIYQEYGTTRMAAHPHVTPAFMQGEPFFESAMKARLRNLG